MKTMSTRDRIRYVAWLINRRIPKRVAGHLLGSAPFSGTWLVATSLPQAPVNPWVVTAGVILPPMVATAKLLLMGYADARIEDARHEAAPDAPRQLDYPLAPPRRPSYEVNRPRQRPALTGPPR